ncbi:MAG: fibronectin type III domain-containing protein [Deltaproteobacteria bacterium]|nr:fibronectin type III domain-containing protein [Deltaproteobacteria bacterium]
MRIPAIVLACSLLTGEALAQSVILDWDPVTLDIYDQPETLRGYRVGYGIDPPGDYTDGFSVGSTVTTARIDDLQNGQTYVFSVLAVDLASNESAWAEEVHHTVPEEICGNLVDDDSDGLTDCQDSDCGPVTEDGSSLCDGFDNDCDSQTDENLDAPDCAEQRGVCSGSTQPCAGASGWQACTAGDYGADYERDETRCDGLDNDCDDATDEDLEGPACERRLGVCQGATRPCLGQSGWGECDYGADYEADETRCDGLDNDCDGSVDEALPGCCTEGERVACSTDEGECVAGEQVCDADGNWSECSGVLPTEEVCDGFDNDCDAHTDEAGDLSPPGCALQEGVCAGSVQRCGGQSGWLACSAGEYGDDYESEETRCDGLDNDCDGQIDEPAACQSPPDGGMDGEADGGTPDAGPQDAGADDAPGADEQLVIEGGCSCAASGRSEVGLGLLLLGLAAGRRRRAGLRAPESRDP